jgi:hypothetical protein
MGKPSHYFSYSNSPVIRSSLQFSFPVYSSALIFFSCSFLVYFWYFLAYIIFQENKGVKLMPTSYDDVFVSILAQAIWGRQLFRIQPTIDMMPSRWRKPLRQLVGQLRQDPILLEPCLNQFLNTYSDNAPWSSAASTLIERAVRIQQQLDSLV